MDQGPFAQRVVGLGGTQGWGRHLPLQSYVICGPYLLLSALLCFARRRPHQRPPSCRRALVRGLSFRCPSSSPPASRPPARKPPGHPLKSFHPFSPLHHQELEGAESTATSGLAPYIRGRPMEMELNPLCLLPLASLDFSAALAALTAASGRLTRARWPAEAAWRRSRVTFWTADAMCQLCMGLGMGMGVGLVEPARSSKRRRWRVWNLPRLKRGCGSCHRHPAVSNERDQTPTEMTRCRSGRKVPRKEPRTQSGRAS